MKLIRRKVKYPIAAHMLLTLFSCVSKIHMGDLAELRMGMSPDEPPVLMAIYPKEVFQWSMSANRDEILVQSYLLASGGYNSTYFLAYRNDSLIFWGYPQEFARSSDLLINEIGREALIRRSGY
jgi:hypothetical protein